MASTEVLPNPADQQVDEEATGGAPVTQDPPDPEPPSFDINNRKLPTELKQVLTKIVEKFQAEELYDRRIEDLVDRGLRFYDDGTQHFYSNYATGAYQIGQAGATVNVGNGDQECSEYLGAYNIFRARRRTIDAVLTQNPPGVDFQPDRPDRSEDIEAAETAEAYRHLFEQKNDIPDIQQSITRMFELSGRCVIRTYTATNREKWGLNDQGEPRKMETCWVGGTLESTVPILCRDQDYAIYCGIYNDIHIFRARKENPWLKEDGSWQISGGESAPGESEWKRYARLGIRQARKGTAVLNTAIGHLITEMHYWLRPAAFEDDSCDAIYTGPTGWDGENYTTEPATNEDGSPQTVRDFLLTMFPEGVCLKFLGKKLSEAYPESMDDAIDIVMSEKRDSLTGGALMEPMKIIQDEYNDEANAEREQAEKGWPMTHFRGDQQDYDAMVDQASKPGQFNLIKSPVGPIDKPMADAFYREPDLVIPPTLTERMENLRTTVSQDVTGASPALEGVAGPKDETASQRAMDKAQSTGILGPTWSRVQKAFAGIFKKAAVLASKNPDHAKEIVVATGDKQTMTLRLEKLKKGKFHCKPDTDSGFPDSTAAQRANLDSTLPLIIPTPIGAELLNSPDNWQEILRVKGMNDFTLVPAEAYKKQTREIEILLREAPESNTAAVQQYTVQHASEALQAAASGQPAPPFSPPPAERPSLVPDILDYHMWEGRRCQEFLSSEECYRQIIAGNEAGVRNVRLHAQIHAQMAQMPPPFQPPAPAMLPGNAPGNPQAAQATPQVQAASQPPGAPNQPTL